jgi:hypothetical protein
MSDNPPNPPAGLVGFQRQPDFKFQFSNETRIRISPGEITIIFSYVDETPVGAVRTEQGAITITPTHARRIALTLAEVLSEYEKHFGLIPPEPSSPLDLSNMTERISAAVNAKVTK